MIDVVTLGARAMKRSRVGVAVLLLVGMSSALVAEGANVLRVHDWLRVRTVAPCEEPDREVEATAVDPDEAAITQDHGGESVAHAMPGTALEGRLVWKDETALILWPEHSDGLVRVRWSDVARIEVRQWNPRRNCGARAWRDGLARRRSHRHRRR
jgi:hypothetical protein